MLLGYLVTLTACKKSNVTRNGALVPPRAPSDRIRSALPFPTRADSFSRRDSVISLKADACLAGPFIVEDVMRGFRRTILVGVLVSGVIALAWPLWPFGETQDYRDCVALMWDRKHPAEVARLEGEAKARRCEATKLRYGGDICFDFGKEAEKTSCSDSLSLEELRRCGG
jgi:hypothetical protein